MACLGITGAMRTAPTAATEVLLGLPPLDLQLKAEAKAGMYRFYCSDQWKPKFEGSGHAYVTQGMKAEPILQLGTNRMIPRHVYDKPCTVRFPDRSDWKDGFRPVRKGGLIWCTDGSKTNALPQGCMVMVQGKYITVFQTEAYAVKPCTVENVDRDYNIETSTFSQTAKLGLDHLIITR
jgi:hypothetical protein